MSQLSRWTEYFNRPVPNITLRIAIMLAGLATVAFGIALSRSTGMGTTVISCIPAALSFAIPSISMGVLTFAFNMLLLVLEICLLGKKFKKAQLLCIPFVLVFSVIIDFFVPLADAIPMPNYAVQLCFSVLSCLFIAVGVWLQIKAKLVLLPGEGFVLAISTTFDTPFSKTKIANDCTMMAIGACLSLLLTGGLHGVREGTVIACFLVGFLIKGISRLISDFEPICPTVGHPTLTPD